ncbi:uncharacterized protein LOC134262278, partial [Saccostrea cucullata]|uniref:uncharacterized protein LOC134262278 n=1 Tax=Saccostrea cuccullata TaxID=36930 RepID=UPI002ED54C40
KSQRKNINEDLINCGNLYRDIEFLQTFNIKDWLDERNKVAINFIRGCCGEACSEVSMAKTLESLYGCRNQRFVSPISFAQSLIGFYITGSKSALTLSTKGSSSGSYSTVQNWIADQGKQKIQCPQHADVVYTFFNNNQ